MKKNNMLRIASVLLVAVLLSTCAISGAFARYTTEGTAADETARVAKWGIVLGDASATSFLKEYTATATDTEIVNTVVSTEEVVAPGTSGTVTAGTISGSAEVAVRVTHKIGIELSQTGWTVEDAYYCPLIFTITKADGSTETVKANVADDAVAFNQLYAEIEVTEDFAAGTTDWSSAANSITWAWEIESATDSEQTDILDTKLAKAAYDGTASTVTLSIQTTVTQID